MVTVYTTSSITRTIDEEAEEIMILTIQHPVRSREYRNV